MLKSRFNLAEKEVEEHHSEEEPHRDRVEGEEEGGEAVAEEEKIIYPERKLSSSEISVRMGLLGKTAEGDGYTYLKVNCTGMSLTELSSLITFKHLQYVDVSNNFLDLDALQTLAKLPYLLLIQANQNVLRSMALHRMKYLQVIIANDNKISSVYDVFQPELSTLELGNNKIRKIEFQNRMPTMRCLDFRNNMIEDIVDINFPNLDSLYLAGNKIRNLIGLESLVNLRILHVRHNPIKYLHGFGEELKKLQYVNMRNCKVSTLKQVKRLRVLTALETLVMKGCPYMGGTGEEDGDAVEEVPETRVEMLAALPRLKRINKEHISPEERTEANDLMMQWLEEGEKDEEEIEEQGEEESRADE